MSNNEQAIVNAICEEYTEKPRTKFNDLLELDKKVKRPANIFAYAFGSAGALVLGTGMCLAMKVIGKKIAFMMPFGIVIGCVGIAMVTANYFLYKKILKSRKAKYGAEILSLSNELLHE